MTRKGRKTAIYQSQILVISLYIFLLKTNEIILKYPFAFNVTIYYAKTVLNN